MSKENNIVGVDFETAYDSLYSLQHMSVANYVKDPRFDAYLVSIDDGEDIKYVGRPELFSWSRLDGMIIAMHNASFDYCVLARIVELGKIPRMPAGARFICTSDLAAFLGCRRDLKSAALYLLGEEISKATRTAMKGKASADLQNDADVLKYAGDDARLCYAIAAKYLCDWPEGEQRVSELNREAGIRGIHTDVALVDAGIATLEPQLQAAMDKIPWVKNGDKPLSPNALRKHGQALGLPVPASLAKDSPDFVEWAAKYAGQYPWVKAVGEYRSINALLCRVQSLRDGIDRRTDMFPFGIKYFGAATGRFSGGGGEGAGRFNCQNMPRGAMYGVDLRPMFMAKPGHTFVIADYAQIEARFLLFWVGNKPMLDLMRSGKSVYQAYAEAVGLAKPGVDLKHTDPDKYKYAKACFTPETLVLTSSGYKPIVRVMPTDLVWDGQAWVAHEGVYCNGYRDRDRDGLVKLGGGYATPDHRVYVGDSDTVSAGHLCQGCAELSELWRAANAESTDWDDVRLLAAGVTRAIAEQARVACSMRMHLMRKSVHAFMAQCSQRVHDALSRMRCKSCQRHKGDEYVG